MLMQISFPYCKRMSSFVLIKTSGHPLRQLQACLSKEIMGSQVLFGGKLSLHSTSCPCLVSLSQFLPILIKGVVCICCHSLPLVTPILHLRHSIETALSWPEIARSQIQRSHPCPPSPQTFLTHVFIHPPPRLVGLRETC